MEFFAGYGFNKSHSTTYAWLAYQTGYLKANYPAPLHGGAADDRGGRTPTSWRCTSASAATSASRSCRPTSTRASCRSPSSPEGVRFGLCAVKNVGEGAILSMLGVRKELGRSTRCSPCASMSTSGWSTSGRSRACQGRRFDSLRRTRRDPVAARARLFAAVDRAIEHGSRPSATGRTDSISSSTRRRRGRAVAIPLPDAAPWTEAQQLAFEKESLGLYMSGHPLERFSEELKTFGAKRVAELTASQARRLGRRHRHGPAPAQDQEGRPDGGLHARRHRRRHRSRGLPGTFGKHGSLIDADAMLLVRGKFEKDEEIGALVATELLPIARAQRADDARSRDPPVGPPTPADLRGAGRTPVAASRRPPVSSSWT